MAINSPHEELMTAALNKRMPSMKAMKALFTDPPFPISAPPPPIQMAGTVVPFPSVMSNPNIGKINPAATINRIVGRDNVVPLPITPQPVVK